MAKVVILDSTHLLSNKIKNMLIEKNYTVIDTGEVLNKSDLEDVDSEDEIIYLNTKGSKISTPNFPTLTDIICLDFDLSNEIDDIPILLPEETFDTIYSYGSTPICFDDFPSIFTESLVGKREMFDNVLSHNNLKTDDNDITVYQTFTEYLKTKLGIDLVDNYSDIFYKFNSPLERVDKMFTNDLMNILEYRNNYIYTSEDIDMKKEILDDWELVNDMLTKTDLDNINYLLEENIKKRDNTSNVLQLDLGDNDTSNRIRVLYLGSLLLNPTKKDILFIPEDASVNLIYLLSYNEYDFSNRDGGDDLTIIVDKSQENIIKRKRLFIYTGTLDDIKSFSKNI